LLGARRAHLAGGDGEVRAGGPPRLPRREGVRRYDRRLLRHVPLRRRQHAPGDVAQFRGPARAGRPPARHAHRFHPDPDAGHAAGLSVALAFGAAANTHLYVYLWPRNPVLVATALICLLMGCAVVFSWSARRMILLGAFTCIGFMLVSTRASAEELGGAPVVSAVGALAVGAVIAVAGASILGRTRARLAAGQAELAAFSARLMAAQEEERRRLAREL